MWISLSFLLLQAFEDIHLKNRPTLEKILEYSNYFFAVIFGLEFLLKLIGYGFVGYFTSFWNLLDVFIVAVSKKSKIIELSKKVKLLNKDNKVKCPLLSSFHLKCK